MSEDYAVRSDSHQATQTAPKGTSPAPKTNAQVHAPSAQELIASKTSNVESADSEALQRVISTYTEQVFRDLEHALDSALQGLAEPKRPPPKSVALALIAGLVGSLTELALNYFTAGLYKAAKDTLGHVAIEALHETTEQMSIGLGHFVEGKIEHYLERQSEREHQEKKEEAEGKPRPEHHFVNPSAKNLVEEFGARQRKALNARHANVQIAQIVGAVSRASNEELIRLVAELEELAASEELTGRFQEQIVFGWLNFCARASLGDEDLKQGKENVVKAPQLAPYGQHMNVDGAIDVNVGVPAVINGVAGLKLQNMVVGSKSDGAVRVLRNEAPMLMDAPVVRRVNLVFDDGLLGSTCVMVLFPNGSMSIDHDDPFLGAIGKMLPLSHSEIGDTNKAFADMGAQMLLNWLRPFKLEKLQ